MANWTEFATHIRTKYAVQEETNDVIRLGFDLPDGRHQQVFLWRMVIEGAGDWVQIESPIGEFTQDSVAAAVRAAEDEIVGGIGCSNDVVTFRHAITLMAFNPDEFEAYLTMVTMLADRFEKTIFGTDLM